MTEVINPMYKNKNYPFEHSLPIEYNILLDWIRYLLNNNYLSLLEYISSFIELRKLYNLPFEDIDL